VLCTHTGGASSLAWSPDGTFIASARKIVDVMWPPAGRQNSAAGNVVDIWKADSGEGTHCLTKI
jgi:WD40 repeat protein